MIKRNKVVQILMDRDNETLTDAIQRIKDTRDEILEMMECECTYDDIEDIIACNLSLEPDYLFNIIYFKE